MKKYLLALTLLTAPLTATNLFAQGGRIGDDQRDAAKHGWLFNYDQAQQLAAKTNRPLMIVIRCVP